MKEYTEKQIKDAFWEMFHKSGELWFNYLGSEDENTHSTEAHWNSFRDLLANPPKN